MIIIFTDGSSRGNPGPGGWGCVVVDDIKQEEDSALVVTHESRVIELGNREANTTNNRMELMAAIEGLQTVKREDAQISVFSDSSYVIRGITLWIHGWKRNSWKTKAKKDVLNIDLWKRLDEIVDTIGSANISWKYVGGHIGVAGNERCDQIATVFADGGTPGLYDGPFSGYTIKNILDVSHDVLLSAKKSASAKSSVKAYSYVSSIGGRIEVHHSWAECEKRVRGARGARYKKSISPEDEQEIIDGFSALLF